MITSRRRCGTISRNRSSRLPISSDCRIEIPVTLPSGRAATKPTPGSDATAKTIGVVVVACCTTAAAAPYVTITSTFRRRNSDVKSLTRLELPPAQRYSTSIVSPAVQPSSRRRMTKAAVHELQTVASAPSTPIRRSSPPCCARAAMGHVPARPQTILMNSRRSMASLRPKGHTGAPEKYQIIDGELLPASHLKGEFPMSALGQKRTSQSVWPMSALPPKADIHPQSANARLVASKRHCGGCDRGLLGPATAAQTLDTEVARLIKLHTRDNRARGTR